MPDLGGLQFPPPRSWEDFEDLCVDLFAAEWRGIQRHGRSGQSQRGVDIFGQLPDGGWAAIQCKRGKVWPPARLSLKEVERDIAAARTFEPPLGLFIVATTMEADAKLQALARRVTQEHSREGLFRVQVAAWDELMRKLVGSPDILQKHYPTLFQARSNQSELADLSNALANERVHRYREAVQWDPPAGGQSLIAYTCRLDGEELSSEAVIAQVVQGQSTLVIGPSGCGKSLLAAQAARRAIAEGGVATLIAAKYFDGDLAKLADQEVAAYADISWAELQAAVSKMAIRSLLILDGYNECPERLRDRLARQLAAAARETNTTILITSQAEPESPALSRLAKVNVPPPDLELKRLIAVGPGSSLTTAGETLIEMVQTGLEAHIVGVVNRMVPPDSGRYELIEAYVRHRLGTEESVGIDLLSSIAGELSRDLAFSLPIRTIERLCHRRSLPGDVLNSVSAAGFLVRRGDRMSFTHEMFLDAFIAESVVRQAEATPERLLSVLQLPQHQHRLDLIVGAVDSAMLKRQALDATESATLVVSAAKGDCGRQARRWAETVLAATLAGIRDETRSLHFIASSSGWPGAEVDASTLVSRNRHAEACVDALSHLIAERDDYLDEVLSIVDNMDVLIHEQREQADSSSQSPFSIDALFAAAYVSRASRSPGLTSIVASNRTRVLRSVAPSLIPRLSREDLSIGQLYLLLTLLKFSSRDLDICPHISRLINDSWGRAPYHLRLELLYTAQSCAGCGEDHRSQIRNALEGLPQTKNLGISSTLVDALKALGAFDDAELEHEAVVLSEIHEILSKAEIPSRSEQAWGIYNAQFDHPYDGAYFRAVSSLPDSERHDLLRLALDGSARDEFPGFFLDSLMIEYISTGLANADSDLIRPWLRVPVRNLGTLDAFITAHVIAGIAGWGPELIENPNELSATARALATCGELLYWANRIDLPFGQRTRAAAGAWSSLKGEDTAADAIAQCEPMVRRTTTLGDHKVIWSVADAFPEEVLTLCRRAFERWDLQMSHFGLPGSEVPGKWGRFVVGHLARFGNEEDLTLLRKAAGDLQRGPLVVAALREVGEHLR